MKALEPTIEDLVERAVEKRLAAAQAAQADASGKLVLGFRDCHTRYGISRKTWMAKIAAGEVRGMARRMKGGKTGYVVSTADAARAFGGTPF